MAALQNSNKVQLKGLEVCGIHHVSLQPTDEYEEYAVLC